MPRKSTGTYPPEWPTIALEIKAAADWTCIRCGVKSSGKADGDNLTVHHLDLDKSNCRWWNLVPLCQRCHLRIQARVVLNRPWVMAEHSEWFRVYVAGWYAWRYLGESLDREQVTARLDELLDLERKAILE